MFHKKNIVTFVFVSILLFGFNHVAHAGSTVIIPVMSDSSISSFVPNTANANSAYMKVGVDAPAFDAGFSLGISTGIDVQQSFIKMRYLGKLNLSSLGTTKIVEKAVLKFDRNSETLLDFSSTVPVYSLHSLLNSYNENTVTWNTAPSIDLNNSVISTIIQEPTIESKKADIAFDITGMVQNWVDGTVANNGFLIKKQDEGKKNYGSFASESASTLNAVRPYVEITYSDPVDISTEGQATSTEAEPQTITIIVPVQPQSVESTTSSLTQEQITTITSLLQSFGVGQSTINAVQTSLGVSTNTTTVTTQPSQSPVETSQSPQTLSIVTGPFGIGMTSPQVTILQQTLAKDASIYPEANISGFYGTLTIKAVERFQCKYQALCSGSPDTNGYGLAGPQTRSRINEVFSTDAH